MGFKTNHFNEFISFKDWVTNFEDIENTKENYPRIEKVGIPLESISEETKIIRNFNFGGFYEILNNGKYYLCLGNEDWLEDDNKKIENELYNWCCGELFNWNNKLSDHIEITRKVMEHCEKDKSYLWEIVNEYIESFENINTFSQYTFNNSSDWVGDGTGVTIEEIESTPYIFNLDP